MVPGALVGASGPTITSGTFVTPALGTPASGSMQNCSNYPASALTGTLGVGSGGTGDTGTAWTSFTPTMSVTAGSVVFGTCLGRYKQLGKTYFVEYSIVMTTNTSGGGFIIASLPNSATAQSKCCLIGREDALTGKALQGFINASATNMTATFYDNSYAGGTGASLFLSGVLKLSNDQTF